MTAKSMLERAYELARSGQYATITGVKAAMKREGYTGLEPFFVGASLRKDLRNLIKASEARAFNDAAS